MDRKKSSFKTDAMLYCEEGWNNEEDHFMDARGMSDGTLRFLAIAAALLVEQSTTLLIVEEVDNGLHPSRAHILLDILKQLGEEKGTLVSNGRIESALERMNGK